RERRRQELLEGDGPGEAGHGRGGRARRPYVSLYARFTDSESSADVSRRRFRASSALSPKPGGLEMRRRLTYVALATLVLLAAGASSTFAARGSGNITYVFNGRLLADAGNSPTLYVDVNGGNRIALKKLVGLSDNQNFAV